MSLETKMLFLVITYMGYFVDVRNFSFSCCTYVCAFINFSLQNVYVDSEYLHLKHYKITATTVETDINWQQREQLNCHTFIGVLFIFQQLTHSIQQIKRSRMFVWSLIKLNLPEKDNIYRSSIDSTDTIIHIICVMCVHY